MSNLAVDWGMGRAVRIFWVVDGEQGGALGEGDPAEDDRPAPKDREEWECWKANRACRDMGAERDSSGFFWETEAQAKRALAAVKAALKQEREMPDWAKKALAEGWKPPKGWKA